MWTRITTITTLTLIAVACGREPRIAGGAEGGVAEGDVTTGASSSLAVSITSSAATVRPGDSLRIIVTVENTGRERRTVEATSGCFTDYELLDPSGQLVARSGQMCTAVMSRRELAPGEELSESFVWIPGGRGMPAVAPGSYHLRGLLLQRGDTLMSPLVPLVVEGG